MFIDTHLHLNNKKYDNYLEVIQRAKLFGVNKLITIGTSVEEIPEIKKIIQNENVYGTLGVYPTADEKFSTEELYKILSENINEKIVGIGECGFNQPLEESDRDLKSQEDIFRMQIELAIEKNLPLVVHDRNSDKETLEVLNSYRNRNLRGEIHCFVSDYEFAKKILDLGFYLSFNGIVTYKSGVSIHETIQKMPLDRMLFETDAPHLSPEGMRKENNEPKNIPLIAETIAKIRGIELEELSRKVYSNSLALFDKISV
jgi:TatD DNase family protein